MEASQSRSARLRRRLVRDLETSGSIRTDRVRAAFLAVPRERFLPAYAARDGLDAVYRDAAIPTKFDSAGFAVSSSSQPAIMAEMLERLSLEPGMRVLEIGAGTGYNAALLAELVESRGSVTTVDVDAEVARGARAALRSGGHRVKVAVADGRDGLLAGAPYDRIIVTASAETVPRAWLDQLSEGGLLEVPLRLTPDGAQAIPTLRRAGDRLVSVAVVSGGFMPLRDAQEDGHTRSRPPCLVATEAATGPPRPPLRQISGEAIGTLTTAAKRRLLAIALGDGRRRPLGLRADCDALVFYLTLTLPTSQTVTVGHGWTIGLISRDGRSLAYVEGHTDGSKHVVGSLTAYGDNRAESALAMAVREWDRRGRPGPDALELSVDYRQGSARFRRRWRSPSEDARRGI
jgi:protein-L-isoaspartate(D-aspartate) O-methyltransferase